MLLKLPLIAIVHSQRTVHRCMFIYGSAMYAQLQLLTGYMHSYYSLDICTAVTHWMGPQSFSLGRISLASRTASLTSCTSGPSPEQEGKVKG